MTTALNLVGCTVEEPCCTCINSLPILKAEGSDVCTTATLLAGFLEGKIIALANAVVVSVENGVKASSTDVDPCYLLAVE